MAFRLNDADALKCQHCGRDRADCGWSLWMHYDKLPGGWKGSVDRRCRSLDSKAMRMSQDESDSRHPSLLQTNPRS